ncbi:MAG TPA: kynureninase [Planctomycetota bacterium]|nr:kynureninase [Planctomycetota bacterium]
MYASPNALATHYRRFRVSERLLLTGHSHQAWPDVAFEGQQRAWLDAAEHVDDKWHRVMAVADRVRAGYRRLLGGIDGDIALAASTHELVVRLLSALDLRTRPRVVTTDGEFHSIRRQLDRLAEEGLEVTRVPADPVGTLAERLGAEVDDRTACAMVSSVLFASAEIVPHLEAAARACEARGSALLIDAYHHLNVVPFEPAGLERAFVTGGGYKYCQLGEGNAFLRVPADAGLRPAITGWFAEFEARADAKEPGRVAYAPGAGAWAGATFDPTAHYRAAAVFDFFERHRLTPALLREVSRHQVGLLARLCSAGELEGRVRLPRSPDPEAMSGLAGFLALRTPRAGALSDALRDAGVWTDARADVIRLGPAPYLSDAQLEEAVERVAAVARSVDA